MTEQGSAPRRAIPVLTAVLVCDAAVAEPATGKKSLIGIFDRIYAAKFPTDRPMSLYMKVTDAQGDYKFEARFVKVSSGNVLAKAEGVLHAPDRLLSMDLYIQFPTLQFSEEGRYEFQVWTDDVFLGSTFVDAKVLA